MTTNSTKDNTTVQRELSIRSENIQRIYNFYRNDLFFVNRRYQRKLVWTLDEKRSFIDSLVKGYPVPIILLAETSINGNLVFEIIDGMQRLNAITAFIEGSFDYSGSYFDLETMVESKSLLDSHEITQKEPKMNRRDCEVLAGYVMPLSVYVFDNAKKVDEIFKRINSGGKHLSRQELRSAGSLGIFADLVRRVSAEIRTDTTASDILNLAEMGKISITNHRLDYGIDVDGIFWVKNTILTKEMVRESRDEEIVADLLASMALFHETPSFNSDVLDGYYGFKDGENFDKLEIAIKKLSPERIQQQFIQVYNELRNVLEIHANQSFHGLIFNSSAQRLPRYFEIVFLAFYKLMFYENKRVHDYKKLVKKLDGISTNINITAGGNWSSSNKADNIDSVVGIIGECFTIKDIVDPGNIKWLTEFETILSQSRTEQTLYDFKQGFLKLDGANVFDSDSFSKIIKSLIAMANNSSNVVGYVCVGVADNDTTAERVKKLYGVEPVIYRNFKILGIGHEAEKISGNLDKFFQWIIGEIKKQPIMDEAKDIICREIRLISYHNKDILIFKLPAGKQPRLYDNEYYRRHGANVDKITPEQYPTFFTNYQRP